ncbi:MAG: PD-(D/E)XK nuclease family protein [Ilumatobacter sp.]
MADERPSLSPAQERTLAALRRGEEAVEFDRAFVTELRDEMQAALDHFASRLGERDELFVSKHRVASVLECEEHHLQPDEFEWTPANAKGTVAHKAIELFMAWRDEPVPADLVDAALERLADSTSGISSWIATLDPAEEADLRSQSTVRVTTFMQDFPPLTKRAAPVLEASVRWPKAGPIVLSGKVDLMFGRPNGIESTKVIVDFKTGRMHPRHRQDLGFYALLETLVREVPPRKIATFYLDAAEAQVEDVSEAMLNTAMRRTLDAIEQLVQLHVERRPPTRRPGSSCRWCPLRTECELGIEHLAARFDD